MERSTRIAKVKVPVPDVDIVTHYAFCDDTGELIVHSDLSVILRHVARCLTWDPKHTWTIGDEGSRL